MISTFDTAKNEGLTEDTRRTADNTKTGSAAASKMSYFAIRAKNGIMINGTMIIRLTTATKTVLFSPGYPADEDGPLTSAFNLRSKKPPLALAESSEVNGWWVCSDGLTGGAGGV